MLVGITGSNGFIGTHLVNYFSKISKLNYIQIHKDDFNNHKLHEKVSECDVIIHLAGLNRHNDSKVIFDTNVDLTKKLIIALEKSEKIKHLIFSSSTQESRENSYGKSKRKSQELFSKWAENNSKYFTNLIIPNVFGPYCKPHYNSVVSTFAHQLINNINPSVIKDNSLELVYVQNLVVEFDKITRLNLSTSVFSNQIDIKFDKLILVSKILEKMKKFKKNYIDNGIIPKLTNDFEKNLFITFFSYLDDNFFPRSFDVYKDDRGSFSEVVRSKSKGQFSYSITKSGVIRGEHFHTRKIERFIVISGKAEIKIRRVNEKKIKKFLIDDSRPSYIDIPVWSTHNIKNIGNNDLITLFWINEHYDEEDHDTFHELVEIK